MSFSSGIRKEVAQIASSNEKTMRGTALSLFKSIIMDTPVMEGRLRGNWQLTTDVPAGGELSRKDKSGAGTVSAMASGVSGSRNWSLFILTNNLPYADRIEYKGWSKVKAPAGMVRKNIQRIQNNLGGGL